MKSAKELRVKTGLSQSEFAGYLKIPKRTIQDWDQGRRIPPDYILELIEYKLVHEGIVDTEKVHN